MFNYINNKLELWGADDTPTKIRVLTFFGLIATSLFVVPWFLGR